MADCIPDDVLTKILTHLPSKSLARFTCVSKSWQSFITSSNFITNHLNQTTISNNNHLILLGCYRGHPDKERYSLHIDDNNRRALYLYEVLEFPFERFAFNEYFHVLGSCNGLICLTDYYNGITHTVALWNPSIRKSLTLPQFTYRIRGLYNHVLGFGFDLRTNDCKVVRLFYLKRDEAPMVELFKLSTGNWEAITATIDPSYTVDYDCKSQVFFNGAVHWPAHHAGRGALIMSFDMSDEVFHEINLPASFVKDRLRKYFSVSVCREWLSFFYSSIVDNEHDSIWVMKEYGVVDSWTKLYTVDLHGGLEKILGFKKNGDILLAVRNRELCFYDPDTRQIEYLTVCYSDKLSLRHDMKNLSFHVEGYVEGYVESLVLLGMQTQLGRVCDDNDEEKEACL